MGHTFRLSAALFVVWLLWSGHYTPTLIGLGVLSCAVCVLLARRMGILDVEGQPLHLLWPALRYWPWLLWNVLKANLDVIRRILDPRLPIDPRIIELEAGQKTDLGRVIYAQSITLTPGTISLEVVGGKITVHALCESAARELQGGEMDRRVTAFEGEN